jgi:hypothetical protein
MSVGIERLKIIVKLITSKAMFEPKKGQIPGYTGHQVTEEKPDQVQSNKVPTHMIPGMSKSTLNDTNNTLY